MNSSPLFKTAALVLLSSCSFLVRSDLQQCQVDSDCSELDPVAKCVANVCLRSTEPDASVAADSGFGPPGCFTGTPTTDLEFFNRCTPASFVTFDNCARAGICDGGAAPAISKPTGSTAPPTTPLDGGPTETCYDAAARPRVVFMNGSTNFTPFIRAMVPLVSEAGFTIVWQPTSSCGGADTVFNADPARRVMRNPTNSSQSFASYYTPANLPNGTTCLLGNSPTAPAANQEIVEIGQSDIYATSCPVTNAAVSPFNLYEPEVGAFIDVREYLGPVQSMVFVVPANSTQRAISAEVARMVFGGLKVSPWLDTNFLWVRSATTGTTGILSRGIGVPSTEWWGIDQRTAPNMVSQLESVSAASAEKTIGTLSIDFADKEKDNLRQLFFQPAGALAGFLPDLRPFTREKENVRDGHYPLWGPIHLYTRSGPSGDISDGAKAFVSQFSKPRPEKNLLDAMIDTGNVPQCAMFVKRDTEMGPLSAYDAPFQCHCYYEKKLNGGTTCRPCVGPSDCEGAKPACNLGYCEKQ